MRLNELYEGLGDLRNDFRNRNLYGLLLKCLVGVRVLDVGCGVGNFVKFAVNAGFVCVGLEPDKKIFWLSRKINPDVNVFNYGVDEVGCLGTAVPDTVVMIDVLEHLEDDVGALRKLFGFMKKNSKLLLVVPAHPGLFGLRDKDMGHHRRYSRKGLVEKLRGVGFGVVSVRSWNMIGFFPYWFCERVLKRPFHSRLRMVGCVSFFGRVLDWWVKHVENRVSFGFGLSLIVEVRK